MSWPCMRQGVCRRVANKWVRIVVARQCDWPPMLGFIYEWVSAPASGSEGNCWDDCRRHSGFAYTSNGFSNSEFEVK